MTTPAERKALNEGTFREANEKLEAGARELVGADDGSFVPFICECPRTDCMEIALVSLSEYQDVRANPAGGIAVAGHEYLSIERIVARHDRILTTE